MRPPHVSNAAAGAAARRRKAPHSVNPAPILRHLTFAYATSVTAELALKHQSADRDRQIAETLRCGVIWPLSEAVLMLEELAGIAEDEEEPSEEDTTGDQP